MESPPALEEVGPPLHGCGPAAPAAAACTEGLFEFLGVAEGPTAPAAAAHAEGLFEFLGIAEGPFEDLGIAPDVYSTTYLVARNATPDTYSSAPWVNPDMWIVWIFFAFVSGSQLFVMLVISLWHPAVVDSETVHVDCANATAVAALFARGFLDSPDDGGCRSQGTPVFEVDLRGSTVAYHAVERTVAFHDRILVHGDAAVLLLRAVCATWIFSQVCLTHFANIKALLRYHDFSRWFLPLSGARVRNGWTICIPLIQFGILLSVATMSVAIICAQDSAVDIVMNSLAFTSILEVAEYVSAPLTRRMASARIRWRGGASQGTRCYLCPGHPQPGATREGGAGRYVRGDEQRAGMLTDYTFRHNGSAYARPSEQLARLLAAALGVVPVVVVAAGALRCRVLAGSPAGIAGHRGL